MAESDVEKGKACAILAYLLVGIIWYFVDENMKKNEFVKYHTKQGLVLLIVSIVGHAIIGILPFIKWILWPIFELAIVIVMIIGIVNAVNGNKNELPVIGQFSKYFTY